MVTQRLSRIFVLAAAALVFAACSSATFTRLAYNNAALAYTNLGPMLTWSVDDYVDLDGAREDWVRVRIDRVLAWHRTEELPRYRALLETMLAKSARPFLVEDIASHQRELRLAYHRVAGQVIPDTAEFFATMDASDVEHLERKFAEDNKRFLKESVRGTPEERLERSTKRFNGHIESWVGRLTPEQRSLIASRHVALRDLTEEIMGERRYRQSELLTLARTRPPRAQVEASMKRLFIETDSWRRPEFAARLRERDALLQALIAEMSATLSEEQRTHLQNRVRRFIADISTVTASN